MIPRPAIVQWARNVTWPTENQIEQDLLLSRLIVEIANDPYLGEELIFRGGTCLHKLHMPRALRYSEDLDYVRRSAGGIAELTRAATRLGEALGMEVGTRISEQPKILFRAPFESGSGRMRIKIEINTFERSPALDPVRLPYTVESSWFGGSANVATFALPELIATKLRALYQRLKGARSVRSLAGHHTARSRPAGDHRRLRTVQACGLHPGARRAEPARQGRPSRLSR